MVLIIKDNKVMLLTRAHPNGGRPLEGYPLFEDPDTGLFAYKLGHHSCQCGRTNSIGIRTIDVKQVMMHFGLAVEEYELWKTQIIKTAKTPLRHRIIKFLGGKVGD